MPPPLQRQSPQLTGINKVSASISNAVGYAVTKINQIIESVKKRFRTLKSNLSQNLKTRDQIRTYVTTQVNRLVKAANLETLQETMIALRDSIDQKILSHFKSKKAFMQLLEPIRKRY